MTRNTELLEILRGEASSPGDFTVDTPVVPLQVAEAIIADALQDAERWRYARRVCWSGLFDYAPSEATDGPTHVATDAAVDQAIAFEQRKA